MLSQSHIQKQAQVQTLKILPQQIRFLNLLHLNEPELDLFIRKELEENPFLEAYDEADTVPTETESALDEDTIIEPRRDLEDPMNWGSLDDELPERTWNAETGFDDAEPWHAPVVQGVTAREDILEQARFLTLGDRQRLLVEYLIDSLDDHGFLSADLDALTDDISFAHNLLVEEAELEAALAILQSLEPAGIGARNLRECLLIQIERFSENVDVDIARALVRDYMEALGAHQYERIREELDIDGEELREALDFIVSLNPRPLRGVPDATQRAETIQPDYLIETDGDELLVTLPNSRGGYFRVQESAETSLKLTTDKPARQFIAGKIEDARWLVEALAQRDDTMLRTMRTLLTLQREFFLTGDFKSLKPMTLRDVAGYTNLDPSTISRVTSTKYVQTPFGIFLAKDLFTQTFTGRDGRALRHTDVVDALKDILETEDAGQPFNDSELCKILEERGFPVARRTVAKYRESLGIPTADLRRKAI